MLQDTRSDSGILYTFSGASAAAKSRAENAVQPKIELRNIDDLVPWSEDLHELFDIEYCGQPGCYGSVDWRDIPADTSAALAGMPG